MRFIDTSAWLLQPQACRSFQVGFYHYRCWLRVGKWALISRL